MELTREEASESLGIIEETMDRTQRQLEYKGASQLLMVWGLVWIAGFLGTQYYPERDPWVWGFGNLVGILLTALICSRAFGQVRSDTGPRIGAFWFALFAYAFLYLSILAPQDGNQVAAFVAAHVMFAYVVMGLWLRNNAMLWLGVSITVFCAIGYFGIQPYFGLWMAVTGGGTLLLAGLYLWKAASR